MNQTKIILFIRIIISSAFLLSAVSKVISPGYFEITLVDQGLLTDRAIAAYATRFFVIIELALGLLFLQNNYFKNIVLTLTGLLLSSFSVYLVYLIFQGDNQNCGCFSSMITMNPIEALIKNIVLIFFVYYMFRKSETRKSKIYLPVFILLLSMLFVFIFSPIRSVKEFPFLKYTQFTNAGRVDLADDDVLVAIFDATCDHCIETAKTFKRIMSDVKSFPKVYVLMFSEDQDDIVSFNKLTGTNFAIAKISIDEFFNLIGNSPPRVYYIEAGEVTAVWDENIEENLWDAFGNRENSILELNFEE